MVKLARDSEGLCYIYPEEHRRGGLSGGGSGRRRANGTANGAASRGEERRERAAPVLGAVLGAALGAMEPVALRVGPGREVRRASGRQAVAHLLVRRVLNGRDEVAEQRLGRGSLDAVRASVRVLERLREQLPPWPRRRRAPTLPPFRPPRAWPPEVVSSYSPRRRRRPRRTDIRRGGAS